MDFLFGGFSGLVEVAISHPFDTYKTRAQVSSTAPFKPYAGVTPRLLGVVPMRILFWGSMGTLKDQHPLVAGGITGTLQTLVDAPIENAKIRGMLGVSTTPFRGFLPHCARNIGFACAIAASFPYGLAPLGAVVGTIATHPLDTIKTGVQSGLMRGSVWSGLVPRMAQSVVAMSVGQVLHYVWHHDIPSIPWDEPPFND